MAAPVPHPRLSDRTDREQPVQPGAGTVSSPPSTLPQLTRSASRRRPSPFLAVLAAGVACLVVGIAARYAEHADTPLPEAGWVSLAPGETQRVLIRGVTPPAERPADGLPLEVYDLSGPELKAWMDSLPARGLRPNFLSARADAEPGRFNAIAVRDPQRDAFRFALEIDPALIQMTIQPWRRAGYSPRVLTHYRDSGRVFAAILGIRDGGRSRFNLNPRDAIQTHLNSFSPEDQVRPAGLGVLLNGPLAPALSCAMRSSPAIRWQGRVGLSARDLSLLAADQRSRGWRLDVLCAYRDGETLRFVAVAIENPKNEEWAFRAGLTTPELEQALAAERERGLRPLAVTSYTEDGVTRYTVVWGPDDP